MHTSPRILSISQCVVCVQRSEMASSVTSVLGRYNLELLASRVTVMQGRRWTTAAPRWAEARSIRTALCLFTMEHLQRAWS